MSNDKSNYGRRSHAGLESPPEDVAARSVSRLTTPLAVFVMLIAHLGVYKGTFLLARSPVDPTFVVAGLLLTLLILIRASGRGTPIKFATPVFGLWLCWALAFIGVGSSAYAEQKVTLLATLVPILVLSTIVGMGLQFFVQRLLIMQVALGLVMTVLLASSAGSTQSSVRLVLDGSNTIGSARLVGGTALVMLMLSIFGRRFRIPLAVAAGLCFYVVVRIGSRAPFWLCVFAIVITVATGVLAKRVKLRRIYWLLLALAISAWLVWRLAPSSTGLNRITSVFEGPDLGVRGGLFKHAISLMIQRPLGVGWGNFAAGRGVDGFVLGPYVYPHNVLLELGAEAGLIGLLAFLVVLAMATTALRRNAVDGPGIALYALFLYYGLNALTSGDLVGNRGMWVLLSAGLGLYCGKKNSVGVVGSRKRSIGVTVNRPRSGNGWRLSPY